MGWISEIIKAGRRAGDSLRTMGEDQMAAANEQQKNMNEQFDAGKEKTIDTGKDSVEGSEIKVNETEAEPQVSTGVPDNTSSDTKNETGSDKMDSEGMLTSDENCKDIKPISEIPGKEDTIKEEAAHAKEHFDEMLNNTPDADPSNGIEKHSTSKKKASKKEVASFFDDVKPKKSNKRPTGNASKKTEDDIKLNKVSPEMVNVEDNVYISKEKGNTNYDHVVPEGWEIKDGVAVRKGNKEDGLGKTVKDALVTKHVLKGLNLASGPDSTTGAAEVTHFTKDDNGSKVLVSDEKFKDKVKTGLKSELKSRVSNAGKNLSNLSKNQAPNVSFTNDYSPKQDFSLVSDGRLKELFGDDISCLARVNSYDFTYKPEAIEKLGDKGMGVDNIEHSGVIAQELEDNPRYKGVVAEMPDGTLALKTKELSAANTANIGELAKAIEAIAGRLDNIENMLGDRD